MTAQIPDKIRFKDCNYIILCWEGGRDCIPSSEELGFAAASLASDNFSGRIDHYGVWSNELYLFKIEVTLENPDDTPTPLNARREVLKRYEQFVDYDGNPARLQEHRYDFFVYEDLVLPFTGQIVVEKYDDNWEVPMRAQTQEELMSVGMEFLDGRLVKTYQMDTSDLITEFR